MIIDRLKASGINENNFFIESHKEGRLEIPLDSIDGFKVEHLSGWTYLLHESNMTILIAGFKIELSPSWNLPLDSTFSNY